MMTVMKLSKGYIRDLGRILTILDEHFFLLNPIQVVAEEDSDYHWVDKYIITFEYEGRDIRLEINGVGIVTAKVNNKPEKTFDLDTGDEMKDEEGIAALLNYTQTNQL